MANEVSTDFFAPWRQNQTEKYRYNLTIRHLKLLNFFKLFRVFFNLDFRSLVKKVVHSCFDTSNRILSQTRTLLFQQKSLICWRFFCFVAQNNLFLLNNYDFYATFNETNAGLGISNLLFCFDIFLETEHIQRCGCKDRLLKDGEISYCSQKPNKELKNKTFLNSLCLKYASK